MGPAGLTAVFGMGTGVAPPVWSPERRPGGGQAAQVAGWCSSGWSQRQDAHSTRGKWDSQERTFYASVRETHAATGGEPIGVVKLLGC